ncbi:nucleotidyltransferase family protein [Winogradskya humida]|uniref:MobA-like NTP transferase domain-containing protein n=1 Tax=Winogradskya humida TaxID=113566 RepID=A0ABQ3ZV77_9ACTN|nr:nucleotidyltransferase family protein [Actinoplanes humidus]GIE22489.1 hypothetical protein Ahu01nite_055910 [Actinoplanes humidus]
MITGLVLAAGNSVRFGGGRAKQLLPYGGRTLLEASLTVALSAGFDELIVTIRPELAERVDLGGAKAVPTVGTGCGSSVSAGVSAVSPRSDGIVLLLGDQPGVSLQAIHAVRSTGAPVAVGRYDDGLGHPFWFGRALFGALRALHGDKAVWKLLHSGPFAEVPVAGPVPIDVDTPADYERLLRVR